MSKHIPGNIADLLSGYTEAEAMWEAKLCARWDFESAIWVSADRATQRRIFERRQSIGLDVFDEAAALGMISKRRGDATESPPLN